MELGALTRILIVIVFIAEYANAIKCYQCNSVYDPDCDTPQSDIGSKLAVDCDKFQKNNSTATFCRSIYQKCERLGKISRNVSF